VFVVIQLIISGPTHALHSMIVVNGQTTIYMQTTYFWILQGRL